MATQRRIQDLPLASQLAPSMEIPISNDGTAQKINVGMLLGPSVSLYTLSSATTLTAAQADSYITLTGSGFPVALPPAASVLAGTGYQFTSEASGDVTLAVSGSDSLAVTTISPGDLLLIVSTGGDSWQVVAYSQGAGNVTISGGSIDNTVIGANVPVSANFTDVNLTGTIGTPSGTFTLAGSVRANGTFTVPEIVVNDGTLSGSLSLNNGNVEITPPAAGAVQVGSTLMFGSVPGSPVITIGTGVPTGTLAAGSEFIRQDGSTGARIYFSTGSSWAAVAGV